MYPKITSGRRGRRINGLVTRTRALKFLTEGQLETRLETGKWVWVHPQVYRVVGAPETWNALHERPAELYAALNLRR